MSLLSVSSPAQSYVSVRSWLSGEILDGFIDLPYGLKKLALSAQPPYYSNQHNKLCMPFLSSRDSRNVLDLGTTTLRIQVVHIYTH
jgi:hypothetical protein